MTKTLEILTKYLEHEYAGMYVPVKPLDEIAREIDEARWISVEEGLPEDLKREILFSDGSGECWLDTLNHFSVDIDNYCRREKVKYWMYVPHNPEKP